jgi:hypothetical protein
MSIIYLIESVRNYDTVYKIGYTKSNNSKKNRIVNLQTGNDGKLKIVCEFQTEHGIMLEKSLHNHYKHNKLNGEWFNLDINDVSNFINTCNSIEKSIEFLKKEGNPFIYKY